MKTHLTRYLLVPGLLATLAGCGDETSSGYATPGAEYHLQEINGTAFPARATITFPEKGRIAGYGPCNSWSATQSAPYPWFKATSIGGTEIACPDLDQEQIFYQRLAAMTLIEFSGPTLLLANDAGDEMLFQVP